MPSSLPPLLLFDLQTVSFAFCFLLHHPYPRRMMDRQHRPLGLNLIGFLHRRIPGDRFGYAALKMTLG